MIDRLLHGSFHSFFVWNTSILAHCDAVWGAERIIPLLILIEALLSRLFAKDEASQGARSEVC